MEARFSKFSFYKNPGKFEKGNSKPFTKSAENDIIKTERIHTKNTIFSDVIHDMNRE
jgi:hypothetical protein